MHALSFDRIMHHQQQEWKHLVEVITSPERVLKERQMGLSLHHMLMEPHAPLQSVVHRLVSGMMNFDCIARFSVSQALNMVDTELIPSASAALHSSNTSNTRCTSDNKNKRHCHRGLGDALSDTKFSVLQMRIASNDKENDPCAEQFR